MSEADDTVPDPSLLTQADKNALGRVLDAKDTRFTALVARARIDPGHELRGLDLSGIEIRPEEDVAGYDFTGCVLAGANLSGADLRCAVLNRCDLAGADLRGALLTDEQRGRPELRDANVGDAHDPALDHPIAPPKPPSSDPLDADVQRILKEVGDDDAALLIAARQAYDDTRYSLAEALFNALLERLLANLGADHRETMMATYRLAGTIVAQHRAAEGEVMFRALLPMEEQEFGAEHPTVLSTRYELARSVLNQGRAAKAEAMFRALLPVREQVLGANHVETLRTKGELALAILNQGRAAEAEVMIRAMLPVREQEEGAQHPPVLAQRIDLGRALLDQGRPEDAAAAMGAERDQILSALSAQPRWMGRALAQWARLADAQGDRPTAEALFDEAQEVVAKALPADFWVRHLVEGYRRSRSS